MVIKVLAHPGYSAVERPMSFSIMDRELRVLEVLDRWHGTGHDYLKVKAEDSYIYIIRHDVEKNEWELVMMERG